jgi:hypothetical protein
MIKHFLKLLTLTIFLFIFQHCSIFKPKVKEEIMPLPTAPVIEEDNRPFPTGKTDAWLNDLLLKDPQLSKILLNNKEYQVQVLYTKIDRKTDNQPQLTTYAVHADPAFYFYPASVVKMPVAILALQKIKELNEKGIPVTKEMSMITETASPLQTAVYNDPTASDSRPTIAQYIRKIFLVSDNDAFNRLYEFLGQDYINSNLHKMGYKDAEILHRLSISLTDTENRHTNPLKFFDEKGNLVYEQPAQVNTKKYSKRNDKRGKGYFSEGKTLMAPFDFSGKNRLCLNDMHDILTALVFPSVNLKKQFNITESDRKFLLQYMSQWPRESAFPYYPESLFPDACVKFNLFGSGKQSLPADTRSFNKAGEAYGYLTDVSYLVDFREHVEFLLSATIYTNKDGIFNDDQYDYDTVGLPFFKRLGEIILAYEKQRNKTRAPDLLEFKFTYGQ